MSRILAALLISIFIVSNCYAEEQFSLRWIYKTDGEISALTAGDANNDGINDVILASGNKLYILNSDGNLIQNYNVNPEVKISAISVADSDTDGRNEVIIGTGWMETTNVHEEPFNLSDMTMVEKEKRLLKTVMNKGEIYLIDDGVLSKFRDVDGWVRSLDVFMGKIVLATGGSDMYFFEEIVYDANGTKIRNYTDNTIVEGNVLIFNKTGLISEYKSNDIFYSVRVYDIYGDLNSPSANLAQPETSSGSGSENEIIAGSGSNVYAFSNTLTVLWKYNAMGIIRSIYTGYLNRKEEKRIISGFRGNTIDGISALNSKGVELWTYRMLPQSRLSGFSIGNLDINEDNEIIVASENTIYVLDSSGKMRLKYLIEGGIDRIYSSDLDTDGYSDLIVASKNTITVYKVTETAIKRQLADMYYDDAEKFYNGRDYEMAEEYISNATKIYLEINDAEGRLKAESLYNRILEGSRGDRRAEADSLYTKAIGYYSFRDYAQAMDYAEKALKIYLEINDTKSIERINSLITAIKNQMTSTTIETTTTIPTTSTTYVQTNGTSDKIDIPNLIVVLLLIIITALVALVFTKIRKSND